MRMFPQKGIILFQSAISIYLYPSDNASKSQLGQGKLCLLDVISFSLNIGKTDSKQTTNMHAANRQHTDIKHMCNKHAANRRQTDNKQTANRQQTGRKQTANNTYQGV